MPCPSSLAPFAASHGEAPAEEEVLLSEAEAEAPPSEAAAAEEAETATTTGEVPLTEVEEALEALSLTEGDADGLVAVLRRASPQQQGLVDEFLALCANEALFPRRLLLRTQGCA